MLTTSLRAALLGVLALTLPAAFACGNGLPPTPVLTNVGVPVAQNVARSTPTGPYTTASQSNGAVKTVTPGALNTSSSSYAYQATADTNSCTCGGLAPTDVKWQYSDEEVCKLALQRKQSYAEFFCDEHTARLAGEGAKAIEEFKKANSGVPPPITLFEYSLTQNQFTLAGIELLLKVPEIKENAAVFKKYDATSPMLIVCAPDGQRLATFTGNDCNAIKVVEFLNSEFDRKMAAWLQTSRNADDLAEWKKTQDARRKAAGAISPVLDARLPNAYRFGTKMITGGFPSDDAAFQALHDLGVKTIIRVDGEPPPTERADKLGMRYLHVPVSYAGIPHDKAMQLARIIRDQPGPIYIHCSCGKHRSPSAAGVVEVILGEMTPQQAVAAMWVAGASTDYTGLYASAENESKQTSAALDAVTVELTAFASTSPMTLAMSDIDKVWRGVEEVQRNGWKLPVDGKSEDLERHLNHVIDRFLEADTWEQMKQAPKSADLIADAQTNVAQLLKGWRSGHTTAAELQQLNTSLLRVQQSCYNCHTEYRNALAPKKK